MQNDHLKNDPTHNDHPHEQHNNHVKPLEHTSIQPEHQAPVQTQQPQVPDLSMNNKMSVENRASNTMLQNNKFTESMESVPVVRVWSIRGVEYAIMTWMLIAVAIATNWILVALINGSTSFLLLAAPLALMLVSLPVFAFMFMRLKRAELMDPSLRTESTKRRFSQRTQVISFIVVFFSVLTIVASLLMAAGGESEDLGKTIASALVFTVIWGGVFKYYWNDEHKLVG